MRMLWSEACLAAFVLLNSTAAQAQDVMEGEHFAQTWCSGCHQVNNQMTSARGDVAAPSFKSIAQMNSTTPRSLTVFLGTPYTRMPNYVLTATDIENVSAYIVSLRGTGQSIN